MAKIAYEKKWQEAWKQQQVFVPKIDTTKEKYFATVPYPYANSALHIGHGRTMVAADILTRYQRLLGKNVLFPMGFHISGTPVLAVCDGLARKDPSTIKMTKEAIAYYEFDEKKQEQILQSFTDPFAIADYFSSKIEQTFDSVGISIDWTRQFTTGDKPYQKFIEWQFTKLKEAGMLIQGKYPILYSPVDQNAVGEDDIKDGDVDKVTIQEMVYILFKDTQEDQYFAVATLRPDALFGTTNLWVDPNHTLVRVRVKDQVWIVGKDALTKIVHQYGDVAVLNELQGKELLGKTFQTPLINREVPIASADFIDSFHGTGLVYSSPAGSPHDYMGLVEAKKDGRLSCDVQVINTVVTKDKKSNIIEWNGECPAHHMVQKYGITTSTDPKLEDAKQELYKLEHYGGVLNQECGEFANIPIKHAKEKVTQALVETRLGGIFLDTSRRAQTRAQNPVIVANLDGQWFLDYSNEQIKQKAYDLLDQMTYYPQTLKESQKGYLTWVQKRPCARKRGIGTPLPFDKEWVIESLSDSTIYQMYYSFAHVMKDCHPDDLTLDFFEYVLLEKGSLQKAQKGSVTQEIVQEARKQVSYWKSFDFRYTAPPHMSNHLSFLIYHYAVIFPVEYQPKHITVGGLLIKEGHKISKSKGNGIPLIKVQELFGVDLYRLYVAVGATIESEMDFRDSEIMQLEKRFSRWKSLLLDVKSEPLVSYEQLSDIDKWLVSRFYSKAQEYFDLMNQSKVREAYVIILYEFLNDIFYHQRRSQTTNRALRFILQDYLLIMTPVVPHFCEECNPNQKELLSVSSFTTDVKKYQHKHVEDIEKIVQHIITKASQFDFAGKTLRIVQAPEHRFSLFEDLNGLLQKTSNIKEIFAPLMRTYPQEKAFITKFVPKTLKGGLDSFLSKEKELELLESVVSFFKEQTQCQSVEILEANDSLPKALPGQPIVLRPE
ncbi:MAG: leucine--tRNA ligase [Candidatus Woesearchaeota archaeon]